MGDVTQDMNGTGVQTEKLNFRLNKLKNTNQMRHPKIGKRPKKNIINSMNVIIGLCHRYSGKVVTFQESFFACNRKLSKTSRLLRLAATGNCPDHLGWMTARLTTAITCDTDR